MKKVFILLLTVFTMSCFKVEQTNEEIKTYLNKQIIYSDNIDTVEIIYEVNGKKGEVNKAEYFAEETKLESNSYKTKLEEDVNFYITYDNQKYYVGKVIARNYFKVEMAPNPGRVLIDANNKETMYLNPYLKDSNGTIENINFEIFVNEKKLLKDGFKAEKIGYYNVYSKVDSVRSNDLKISAINKYIRVMDKYLKEKYFWLDNLKEVDLVDYSDPNIYLDDVIYKKYDKWSNLGEKKDLKDFLDHGIKYAFGFLVFRVDGRIFVAKVEKDSDSYEKGLVRGDEIISINDTEVSNFTFDEFMKKLSELEEVNLKVLKKDNIQVEINIRKRNINMNSIEYDKIITVGMNRIGYFMFNYFNEEGLYDLKRTFDSFRRNNISELVIDLRYNPGGLVSTADYLINLLVGKKNEGELSFETRFNKKRKSRKTILKDEYMNLNINRVFFITTNSSASASELVINSVKPYLDVVLIGEKTHGKACGMEGKDIYDKVFYPITFETYNKNGEGAYYDGIKPQVELYEDYKIELGNQEEVYLKAALNFIEKKELNLKRDFQRKPKKDTFFKQPMIF